MKHLTPWALLQVLLLVVLVVPQASSQDRCSLDEGLRDMVENKFDQLTQGPGGTSKKVYVSNVSFIDGYSKTGFLSAEGELINQAVLDGMTAAAATDPDIVVNDASHTVPNTDGSVQTLVDIWFDPGLTRDDKFAQALVQLLDPHQVDVLMTGMIIDSGEGGTIQIRPMGVSKSDRTIRTKDLQYTNRDALFENVDGTLSLSALAREEISKAVSDILEGS